MTIRFVLIALLLLTSGATARAQKLILFEDQDKSGYKDARGKVVIPAKFRLAGEFSKENLAAVLDDEGWCYINKKGRVVIRTPFIFDNGPDYFKEGLARFTVNGKFGFADMRGKVTVAPQFDFAFPFHNGVAAVCLECKTEKADAEHNIVVGGRWGYVNRRGRIIVPVKYEAVEHSFENGTGRVRLNNKWSRVDRKGRILD